MVKVRLLFLLFLWKDEKSLVIKRNDPCVIASSNNFLCRLLSNLFENLSTEEFRYRVFQKKLFQPPNRVLPQFFIKLNRYYQNPFESIDDKITMCLTSYCELSLNLVVPRCLFSEIIFSIHFFKVRGCSNVRWKISLAKNALNL